MHAIVCVCVGLGRNADNQTTYKSNSLIFQVIYEIDAVLNENIISNPSFWK